MTLSSLLEWAYRNLKRRVSTTNPFSSSGQEAGTFLLILLSANTHPSPWLQALYLSLPLLCQYPVSKPSASLANFAFKVCSQGQRNRTGIKVFALYTTDLVMNPKLLRDHFCQGCRYYMGSQGSKPGQMLASQHYLLYFLSALSSDLLKSQVLSWLGSLCSVNIRVSQLVEIKPL